MNIIYIQNQYKSANIIMIKCQIFRLFPMTRVNRTVQI